MITGKIVTKLPEPQQPIPQMMHHTAYTTHDAAATVEFYSEVLGLEFVSTIIDDEVPSTKDPYPYLHLFFKLQDGSMIAFFESIGLPPPAVSTHPAYDVFNHLALTVGSKEEVDCWAKNLRAHGVDVVGPYDHHVIYSIYFHDPNGLRLELTTTTNWKDHTEQAYADLDSWVEAKEELRRNGGDIKVMLDWIKTRRRGHVE